MLIFFGKEIGKKTQFACLIINWITCSFWCEKKCWQCILFPELEI